MDGVPLDGQSQSTEQEYILASVPEGGIVTCVTNGNNGDADLEIFLEDGPANGCSSFNPGSNEQCSVGPASNSTLLHAAVIAYQPYTDLTITCTISDAVAETQAPAAINVPVYLTDGVPLDGQAHTSEHQYILEPVMSGDSVTCTLNGNNGDADLEIFLENDPNNGCSSFSAGSVEQCTVGPAVGDTILYATVIAYIPYTDMTITCTTSTSTPATPVPDTSDGPIYLTSGVTLSGQSSSTEQQYILDPAISGQVVTCTVEGNNGDADLEMFFEDEPANGCSSFNVGSVEQCTVGPAAVDTTAYAMVIAYQPYTDLSITCTAGNAALPPSESLPAGSSGPIFLTAGETLSGQAGNTEQQYILDPIPAGSFATCTISGSVGDADLEMFLDNAEFTGCSSYRPGSMEQCTVGPASADTVLNAIVIAYTPYSDLTITCLVSNSGASLVPTSPSQNEAINLTPGVPLSGQESSSFEQQYILDPVPAGNYVSCNINGNNGDADLDVFLAEAPNNGCSSYGVGSMEACIVGPAVTDTVLYASVIPYLPYTDLTITCSISSTSPPFSTVGPSSTNDPIFLVPDVPLPGQASNTEQQQFILDPVPAGNYVSCNINGNNGDADLDVFLAEAPNNGCSSYGVGSMEACIVGPAVTDTVLYASVIPYLPYTDLTITCSISSTSPPFSTVGPSSTNEPIYLAPDVPLPGQTLFSGSQEYILDPVAADNYVSCFIEGSNGDADLEIFFDNDQSNRCSSFSPGSFETCTVGPSIDVTFLRANVIAYAPYNSLAITCSVSNGVPPTSGNTTQTPIMLAPGVALPGQTLFSGSQKYILDPIPSAEYVTCTINGNNGDADLDIYLENEPNNGCSSFSGGSMETCTVGPAIGVTTLHANVIAYAPYNSLTVTCSYSDGGPTMGSNSTQPAIMLASDIPLPGQSGISGSQEYILDPVLAGEYVACSIEGNNGDADLEIYFESDPNNGCSSYFGGSYETCSIGPASADTILSANVLVYSPYSGLTVTCSTSDTPVGGSNNSTQPAVMLESGVPLPGQSGISGSQEYILDPVLAGEYVACSIEGNNGDADLEIYFESDPNNGCSSYFGGSYETCSIGPASTDTIMAAIVLAYQPFNGLTVTCSTSDTPVGGSYNSTQPAIMLQSGIPLPDQSLSLGSQEYILDPVLVGKFVTCSLEGDNGDADLQIYFENDPSNDCWGADGGSYEMCSIGPASSDTVLHAFVDAYQPYSGLTITCSISDSGPSNNSISAIALTDGVPLTGQSGELEERIMYMLDSINAGDTATCTLSGDNGDADLEIYFEEAPNNSCISEEVGSYETCNIGPASSVTVLYAVIYVFEPYTDLTIICLANAPPLPSPTSQAPTTASPVTSAPTTSTPTTFAPTTSTSSPTTSAPATTPSPTRSAPAAATLSPTTSAPAAATSSPTTSAPAAATSSPTTSAPVTATSSPTTSILETLSPTTSPPATLSPTTSAPTSSSPMTSPPVTLSPTTSAPVTSSPTDSGSSVISLTANVPLSGQSSSTDQEYILQPVLLGENVTCSLNGPDGDADLEVYLDDDPTTNSCSSFDAGSVEECTVGPATSDTVLHLLVAALEPYNNLEILCNVY